MSEGTRPIPRRYAKVREIGFEKTAKDSWLETFLELDFDEDGGGQRDKCPS